MEKQLLSFEGLSYYDELIKKYIKGKSSDIYHPVTFEEPETSYSMIEMTGWAVSPYLGVYVVDDIFEGHTYYYNYEFVDGQWVEKTWTGLPKGEIDGNSVWKDCNGNVYYSSNANQYQYDFENDTWVKKVWTGAKTQFVGSFTWKYDGHDYWSFNNEHYELIDGKWVAKSWNISLYGGYMWEDYDGVFHYDKQTNHYILVDGSWVKYNWNIDVDACQIWKDNYGNIYYSQSQTWKLVGNEWVLLPGTFSGVTGQGIWHSSDGKIYNSNVKTQQEIIVEQTDSKLAVTKTGQQVVTVDMLPDNSNFVTKEELQEAIANLVTKDMLEEALTDLIVKLTPLIENIT